MRDTVITYRRSQVEVTPSYVYLGITFSSTGGRFSMRQAAHDRLTRGYASLALLERQCHQSHFQEPREARIYHCSQPQPTFCFL